MTATLTIAIAISTANVTAALWLILAGLTCPEPGAPHTAETGQPEPAPLTGWELAA